MYLFDINGVPTVQKMNDTISYNWIVRCRAPLVSRWTPLLPLPPRPPALTPSFPPTLSP